MPTPLGETIAHIYAPGSNSSRSETDSQQDSQTSNPLPPPPATKPSPPQPPNRPLNHEALAKLPIANPLEEVNEYIESLKTEETASFASRHSNSDYSVYTVKNNKYDYSKSSVSDSYNDLIVNIYSFLKSTVSIIIDSIIILILLLINMLFFMASEGFEFISHYRSRVLKYKNRICNNILFFKLLPIWIPKSYQILSQSNKSWKRKLKSLANLTRNLSLKSPNQKEVQPPLGNSKSANDPIFNHFLVNHRKRKKTDHSPHDN